jgi:hypothetical protein
VTAKHLEWAVFHEKAAKDVHIVRIMLPGTYAQFQIPGRLERKLAKEMRVCDKKELYQARLEMGRS